MEPYEKETVLQNSFALFLTLCTSDLPGFVEIFLIRKKRGSTLVKLPDQGCRVLSYKKLQASDKL
ncbi:MAG: hypothetical protein JWQ09_1774 [Segetibacter sp.]|nr:hypothetical protein [Segetibacter sp.]